MLTLSKQPHSEPRSHRIETDVSSASAPINYLDLPPAPRAAKQPPIGDFLVMPCNLSTSYGGLASALVDVVSNLLSHTSAHPEPTSYTSFCACRRQLATKEFFLMRAWQLYQQLARPFLQAQTSSEEPVDERDIPVFGATTPCLSGDALLGEPS